jgi:hypothetical protein
VIPATLHFLLSRTEGSSTWHTNRTRGSDDTSFNGGTMQRVSSHGRFNHCVPDVLKKQPLWAQPAWPFDAVEVSFVLHNGVGR